MDNDNLFEPLSPDRIKEITKSIETDFALIIVTLIDGAQLVGALGNDKLGTFLGEREVISLCFNAEQGKRFGHSHVAAIPTNWVADIQPIPLSEKSIPKIANDDSQLLYLRKMGFNGLEFTRLRVQDYPNPLAAVICNHNLKVITSHHISIYEQLEKSLSKDTLPPKGIFLEDDFLFYVDWDFFRRQIPGTTSVNASVSAFVVNAGITKNFIPSLQEFVFRRLKTSWAERTRKGISPKSAQENIIHGCIVVPDATEDTEIEGAKCIVTLCVVNKESKDSVDYPILIKLNCLKFPREFLGCVNSVLTFYGELLPIPLKFLGRTYKNMFLARAIAYLDKK